MDHASVGVIPAAARPGRRWPAVLAGAAIGGAAMRAAVGWVGSRLPPAVGLPDVPGLLFGAPVLVPAVLAALGVAAAGPAARARGRWAAPASLAGLAAVLLAEGVVAWSSASLLIMYQGSLYADLMAHRVAG